MALETLKGLEEIGGYDIVVMDELREKYPEKFNPDGSMQWEWFEGEIRPNNFIYIRNDKNSLSFTLQKGPIKEHGVNGCQVDTLIHAAIQIIEGLDNKFTSVHNKDAKSHLHQALYHLEKRRLDREARGVEGTSQT